MRIIEAFAIGAGAAIVCAVAIGGIVETVNAPPIKEIATAYAETLLPGKEFRVVCPDGNASPVTCAIVYENNGQVTVIPVRCSRSMGSCSVRGIQ